MTWKAFENVSLKESINEAVAVLTDIYLQHVRLSAADTILKL